MASPPSQAAESSAAHASTNADHSSASNDNDRSSNHGSRRPDYRGSPKEPYQKPFPMGMHPAVLPVPAFGMQNGFRGSIMPGDGMMAGMGMPNIVSGPGMMIPFHPGIRMMPGPVPMPMPGPHGFPDHLMGRQFPRPFMMGHHPQQHNNVPIVNAGMDGHYHQHHHHHQGRTENGNHRREYSSGSGGSNASAELRSSTSGVSVQEMKELEDLLSKLNPLAKEFVPPGTEDGSSGESSLPRQGSQGAKGKKKNGLLGGKKRGGRSGRAHREDSIKRTVYVSDIDQSVTEEQLASLFLTCGQVVDCRICGDPNSVLRFAFVEFVDEEGARNALSLAGTVLGYYPVRVLPSKTAIIPVNPTFLPRNEDDRDLCSRTVYCANIDKKVTQADVKLFFESLCGEVGRLRLLGDFHHSTRIAFVEFIHAESAMAALNCSGAILGSLPIRVSPSKTPVRPRSPHPHHNR